MTRPVPVDIGCMPLDCLVLGGSGTIGREILAQLAARGARCRGTCHETRRPGLLPLDIRARGEIASLFAELRPRRVIVAAGLAGRRLDLSGAAAGLEVNHLGIHHVAVEANRIGAEVVYLSSAEVFSGERETSSEDDPASPATPLGILHLAAEHAVALHAPRRLIVRTTDVFGDEASPGRVLGEIILGLARGEEVAASTDRFTTPTPLGELVEAILTLAERGAEGVFHVASREWTTRYDFARLAAQCLGFDPGLIRPVPTAAGSRAEPALRSTCLCVQKSERTLGRKLMSWESGLLALSPLPECTR